jgi:hypothetical protein
MSKDILPAASRGVNPTINGVLIDPSAKILAHPF